MHLLLKLLCSALKALQADTFTGLSCLGFIQDTKTDWLSYRSGIKVRLHIGLRRSSISLCWDKFSLQTAIMLYIFERSAHEAHCLLSFFQNVEDHVAFVITVPTALAIFLAVFVLVCIESIFKKLLRIFSLVIWACLVAMGYLFMFSGGIVCPWDQVRRSCFSEPLLSGDLVVLR